MSDVIHDPTAEPISAQADSLHKALLDSRQRWQELCSLAADLVFETDVDGRLTFVVQGGVLDRPGADLLGLPARALLADPGAAPPGFGTAPMHQQAAWVRRADGDLRCLSVTVGPRLDGNGRVVGVRGVGVDVTGRERRAAAAAAALRRAELLDHVLAAMRREVVPARMMSAVLGELLRALGADGAAILDLQPGPEWGRVLHAAGADAAALLPIASGLLHRAEDGATVHCVAGGWQVLACPASTRFGERSALLAWRPLTARLWDADDHALAAAVIGILRMVLEHEAIQRELARQARTDPLTGLLNRRAFLEEAGRRLDRLDREGLPGTLVFVDLDHLKPLNDRLGHEAGDAALVLTAALLRRTFRPTDLLARLGGDEFALWLDGSDELTAAERAERLRTAYPAELAHFAGGEPGGMTLSIGIACRSGSSGEELDSVIQRADQAIYQVKRLGGGQWRVSQRDLPL